MVDVWSKINTFTKFSEALNLYLSDYYVNLVGVLYKLLIFILIQLTLLAIWLYLLKNKGIKVDWKLILTYFIFGSWFGMAGELFLNKIIEWTFGMPLWEYRVLPIHNGATSSFGPVMWGIATVYVCFHKNYQLYPLKIKNPLILILLEAGYLLVLELIFNFVAFFLFNDYFFYYFVPDLWHWSSFTALPFWWIAYKVAVKYSSVLYDELKLNIVIAAMLIVVLLAY